MDSFFTAKSEAETTIIIERSKFISRAAPAETEEEARNFIARIKKQHSLATHNCHGYSVSLGAVRRFSDDGEPSGTAGQPIIDAIISSGLVNTVVVVTRYFGGIKLGAGGLVRAYSRAATEALAAAGRAEYVFSAVVGVNVTYDKLPKIEKIAAARGRKLIRTDFGEQVFAAIAVAEKEEKTLYSELGEAFSGEIGAKTIERKFLRLTDL